LLLSGVVSALSAWSAVGLWMPKTWRVWASRKFDCGLLSVMTTVVSFGASTETMFESAPKPPKTAP
jgi:hypothetical protein